MTGRTISHYRILERLGEGAMGVVYKAEDDRLRRTVALKFLSPQSFGSTAEKKRFLREAQAGAMLDHPNVAAVYEVEEAEGQTFIVMAFVDGPTVAGKLLLGTLPVDEALDIAIQAGQGLQEAHEHGIVHRDVKPSNVIVSQKGQAKITDFGVAQLAGRSRLTRTGTTLGTPAYMSPEQALGKPTDRRCDIWSLGVTLYQMLAGRAPFDGEYEQAIVYSIINEDHEPLSKHRAGLPAEMDRILAKALAKNPEERYQHVDEFVVDLRAVRKKLYALSGAAREQPATGQVEGQAVSGPRAGSAAASPAASRQRLFAVVIAIAVVALVAAWVFRSG
jgi:non-specific serine/threonine protein kinase